MEAFIFESQVKCQPCVSLA